MANAKIIEKKALVVDEIKGKLEAEGAKVTLK